MSSSIQTPSVTVTATDTAAFFTILLDISPYGVPAVPPDQLWFACQSPSGALIRDPVPMLQQASGQWVGICDDLSPGQTVSGVITSDSVELGWPGACAIAAYTGPTA